MAGKQVRLDPDVADALAARADVEGGSLALHANQQLRHALGLRRDETDVERPVQRASIGRSRAMAGAGPCPHPVGRRRGAICLACGAPAVGRR